MLKKAPRGLSSVSAHLSDKPDQFLFDLAAISSFNDRLHCFMFQFTFADSLADIENRLHIIRSVCEFLTNSEHMKRMFAGNGKLFMIRTQGKGRESERRG